MRPSFLSLSILAWKSSALATASCAISTMTSPAADKRLNAGDTIVEIAQEAVTSAEDFQAKVDKLKKDGRRSALLLVASAEGELRFVALALQ